MDWMGSILSLLTPLFAVPLAVLVFYLRSLREQQTSWHLDAARRFDALESTHQELRKAVRDFERDYASKEEWLRECMQARRKLDELTETIVRIETTIYGSQGARCRCGCTGPMGVTHDVPGSVGNRDDACSLASTLGFQSGVREGSQGGVRRLATGSMLAASRERARSKKPGNGHSPGARK